MSWLTQLFNESIPTVGVTRGLAPPIDGANKVLSSDGASAPVWLAIDIAVGETDITLAANKNLSCLAGTTAVDMHLGTGATKLTTGDVTWPAASGKVMTLAGTEFTSDDLASARKVSRSVPGFGLHSLGAFVFHADEVAVDGSNNALSAIDAGGSAVQFTSTNKFTLVINGPYGAAAPSLRTNNTTGRLFSATGGPTGAQPWHLVYIGKALQVAQSGNGYDTWIGFAAPAAAQSIAIGVNTGGQLFVITDDGAVAKGLQIDGPSPLAINQGEDHIVEVQYDGAKLTFWVDGRHMSTLDQTVALNLSDASFGFQNWYTGGTYPVGDARIDAALFRAGAIVPREKMAKWFRTELRRLGGTGKMVVFFGDSTTAGGAAGTTSASYLPNAVKRKAVAPVVIYSQNQGMSGLTSAQILTQGVVPHTDPLTHAHIWWGVNDVSASTAAATIYANTIAAVKHLQKRGAKVIVGTLAQWGALVSDGTKDAIRVAYNALVLANSAKADAVADISAAMGAYSAGNFCADTLHPNDSANDTIIAPAVYAVLAVLGLHTVDEVTAPSDVLSNGQLLIGSTGVDPVAASLTGTANQVVVTGAAGTITLSTPQDIGTASSPTFASQNLTGSLNRKGITTTGLTAGNFAYDSGAAVASHTDADDIDKCGSIGCVVAVGAGSAGSIALPGAVVTANLTTVGGSPGNGDVVYLASATEEASAAGKLSAAPSPANALGAIVVAARVVDNSLYASAKTCVVEILEARAA
jgi:lysophospholipase L1-like esterase